MTETAVSAISRCVFLDISLCAPRQLLFSLTAAFAGSDVLPPQAACQHNPSCHLGGTSFKGEQRSKQLCQPLKRIKTPVSSDADRGLCGSPSQIKRSHHQISFFQISDRRMNCLFPDKYRRPRGSAECASFQSRSTESGGTLVPPIPFQSGHLCHGGQARKIGQLRLRRVLD